MSSWYYDTLRAVAPRFASQMPRASKSARDLGSLALYGDNLAVQSVAASTGYPVANLRLASDFASFGSTGSKLPIFTGCYALRLDRQQTFRFSSDDPSPSRPMMNFRLQPDLASPAEPSMSIPHSSSIPLRRCQRVITGRRRQLAPLAAHQW